MALALLAADPELRDLVSARGAAGGITVLTPHDGEFSRFEPVGDDRREAALRLAASLSAIVVLKGAGTVIADHIGRVFIDAEGTSDLATAGSGDVLAGLMGGLLAAGGAGDQPAIGLVAAAVFIHGRAGRIAGEALGTVTASDIADCLEPALAELL